MSVQLDIRLFASGHLAGLARYALVLGLSSGLLACGGDDSGASGGLDQVSAVGCVSAEHLREGLAWELEYRLPQAKSRMHIEGEVLGPVVFNGKNVVQVEQKTRTFKDGSDEATLEESTSYQSLENGYLQEHGYQHKSVKGHEIATYDQSWLLEHWYAPAGAQVDYRVPLFLENVTTGQNGNGELRQTWSYHGRGTVKVPAGTFRNACKFTIQDVKGGKVVQWFAAGTGLPVRVESTSGVKLQELVSGQFDGRALP